MGCNQDIAYSTTTEIQIAGGSTLDRHYFPQQQNLRGRQIVGIEAFGVDNITLSPRGDTTTADNVQQVTFVTLISTSNVEIIYNMPLVALNRTAGAASTFYQNAFKGIASHEIDWEKSYIYIANTGLIAPANTAITFTIYYE